MFVVHVECVLSSWLQGRTSQVKDIEVDLSMFVTLSLLQMLLALLIDAHEAIELLERVCRMLSIDLAEVKDEKCERLTETQLQEEVTRWGPHRRLSKECEHDVGYLPFCSEVARVYRLVQRAAPLIPVYNNHETSYSHKRSFS